MKNGIFSLFLVLLLCKPVFAATPRTYEAPNTPASDYPEGDIEKFFTRIKAACDHPETAGNQLPPEHIMISCEDNEIDWDGAKASRMVKTLNRKGDLDVAIFCDKDLGKLKEKFGIAVASVTVACPEFAQLKVTRKMTVNKISCADVKEYPTAQAFCNKVLEDAVPTVAPTGVVVNLCGAGNGQQPSTSTAKESFNYNVIE